MNSQDKYAEYNDSIIKLYYRFLKKIGLFNKLYGEFGRFIPRLGVKPNNGRVHQLSAFSLVYTSKLITGCSYIDLCLLPYKEENDEIRQKLLQYSQLWRLFVLDNYDKLNFIDCNEKKKVFKFLLSEFKRNGTRGCKDIENGLKKYNLEINHTK